MRKMPLLRLLIAALVIAFGFSPSASAAEDGGAAWAAAMETHAGLKGLAPPAGCVFTLDEYTVADGTFTAPADIPEPALMDFIMRIYEASKGVSTAGISDLTARSAMSGAKRPLEDIARFKPGEFDQIGWSYAYDAGGQSKIAGSTKYVLITIDDARNVSFQVGKD